MTERRYTERFGLLLLGLLIGTAALAIGDADVRALLDTLPGGEGITTQVTDGIVTLTGTVADAATQQRIEQAVEGLAGVKSTVSAIIVD